MKDWINIFYMKYGENINVYLCVIIMMFLMYVFMK